MSAILLINIREYSHVNFVFVKYFPATTVYNRLKSRHFNDYIFKIKETTQSKKILNNNLYNFILVSLNCQTFSLIQFVSNSFHYFLQLCCPVGKCPVPLFSFYFLVQDEKLVYLINASSHGAILKNGEISAK